MKNRWSNLDYPWVTSTFVVLKLQPLGPIAWSCGVVVITSALHAEGPRFDPGRDQLNFFVFHQSVFNVTMSIFIFIEGCPAPV